MSNPHNPNELIAIVDNNDNVIGKYIRKNHAEGRLHRESSVLIVNSNNKILVQIRADSDRLDYSASGHFPFDEDYLDGAIREVQEELGLDIPRDQFIKISKHRINYSQRYVNNRFITLWEIRGNYRIEDMNIDPSEVKSVEYMSVPELKRMIKENPDSMSAGFVDSLQIYFIKKGL